MKRTIMTFGLSLMIATNAWSGYRNIEPEERMRTRQTRQRIQAEAEWSAVLERADGRRIPLQNLGERFASGELQRREQARIILTIPDAPKGAAVRVEATHGGRIQDSSRTQLVVGERGRVVIPFQMGTMGGHPIFIRVQERTMGMTFTVEEPYPQRPGVTAEKEEARR